MTEVNATRREMGVAEFAIPEGAYGAAPASELEE